MIMRGSLERLAPVLMTALTAGIGLVPLVLGGPQPGKEILYPVATVILGGLITSTICETSSTRPLLAVQRRSSQTAGGAISGMRFPLPLPPW